jgi:aryl-alcohol dehydrogenase-like predicted oxidoreductase
MEFRHLGRSGLIVSEIAYGNWLTHGSQVEEDQATACVKAALECGITTFDTADIYAAGKAEEVLGRALKGEKRDALEIFTKVYWPMSESWNDRGLSRKHILEAIDASLRRLQMDHVDLYQAHRFDPTTPLEETMQAFADVVRAGKAHYIGVSEWTADQIRAGRALADDLGFQLISNQPQYSALWRVIEAEVIPTCEELGVGQIVFSPIAQGVLTGKYKPGAEPPAGSRATDQSGGADMIKRWLRDDVLERVGELEQVAKEADLSMAALAVAWVLQQPNVSAAIIGASRPEQVMDNVKAAGVRLDPELKTRMDELLAPVATTDPGETAKSSPEIRP